MQAPVSISTDDALERDDRSAADVWAALLRGEWLVTDHFVGPSARSIRARRAGACVSTRASDLEIRIASRRARGASLKEMVIDLGWSYAAVSDCIASVMRRLKLACEADLVALLHEPVPSGLSVMRIGGGVCDCVLLAFPNPLWANDPDLTAAEQSVVLELVAGRSQRAIAQARRTSPRTIANQLASVYRKLGVRSRTELFVALCRRARATGSASHLPPSTHSILEAARGRSLFKERES
jgi:DNA-binding CsgD family transcriptional regulator